jgi:hypothetical protein
MALFRKFFLKKTPDRLLEISERVYGMYNALVSRSSWACWVFDLRWSFTFREDFFFAWAWFGWILFKCFFMGHESCRSLQRIAKH